MSGNKEDGKAPGSGRGPADREGQRKKGSNRWSRPEGGDRGPGTGGDSKWRDTGSSRPGAGEEEPDPAVEDAEGSKRPRRLRRLGEGSYGEVWLVEYLGALEARKYLRSGIRREAFREAVNTRSVNHPNVVKIVDVIEDAGIPALRMEYIEGRDLNRVVDEDGVLTVAEVLPIGIQVADALRATHDRGIVHLDLKPSNLILRPDGKTVVVTDFGISAALRLRDGELQGGRGGTLLFMAPELHDRNGTGSPRSDIWSLGITLYYLVSGRYPFAFGEEPPGQALAREPADLCERLRHIPASFWQILRRCLAFDPAQRFSGMKAVKEALEDLAGSLPCPGCGQVLRFESIAGVCPNPDCQSQAVVPLKSAILSRRAAENALADCSFKEAVGNARRAKGELDGVPGSEQLVAELDAFLKAVPGLEKDHDDSIGLCAEFIRKERYIDAIHAIQAARILYSRSPVVKELRLKLRAKFVELYEATPDLVRNKIRNREFDGARADLSRMDAILGDLVARKELLAGIARELKDFGWLHEEVDRQHEAFQSHLDQGRLAILGFDFKGALEAFTFLEGNYPAEETRRLIANLGRAAGLFEIQSAFDPDELRELVTHPEKAGSASNLALEEGERACRRLLQDFPPDHYPSFTRIQEKADLLHQLGQHLQVHVGECLRLAETAGSSGDLREELRLMAAVKEIVLRADIFDARMKWTVQERLRAVERDLAEAEELYRQGKLAIDTREYPKALANLSEVQRVAPGAFEDLQDLLSEVEGLLDEERALKGKVAESLARLERGDFDLSSAVDALGPTERLHELSDDQERRSLLPRVASCCAMLFKAQADHLGETDWDPISWGGDLAVFLRANLLPLMAVLPEVRWREMAQESRELRRALCELLTAGHPAGTKVEFKALEQGIESLLGVMEAAPAATALAFCVPPQGATHPAIQWGQRLLESFRRGTLASRKLHFPQAEEKLERLTRLCPDQVLGQMERLKADLRSLGRRANLTSRLYRLRDLARSWSLVLMAAGAAGLAFYHVGLDTGRGEAIALVAAIPDQMPLDSGGKEALRRWLAASADADQLAGRVQVLMTWRDLKQEAEPGLGSLSLAARIRTAIAERPLLAEAARSGSGDGASFKALLESFDEEVGKSMDQVLRRLVEDAREQVLRHPPAELSALAGFQARVQVLSELCRPGAAKKENPPWTSRLDFQRELISRLSALPGELQEKVLAPLGDNASWPRFNVGDALAITLVPPSLEPPPDIKNALQTISRLELARAVIHGLKSCIDRARLGFIAEYPAVLGEVGTVLVTLEKELDTALSQEEQDSRRQLFKEADASGTLEIAVKCVQSVLESIHPAPATAPGPRPGQGEAK